MSRNLKYFNDNHIVYRQDPISDKPDQENECYMFYLNGTHECYHLMDDKLRERIDQFNKIKYGNDNETRIIFATLKPIGTVTTAPKYKE